MSISSIRRRAARHGERVVKIPERSRHRWQYGPFMVLDARTNAVVCHGLDVDDLAERYAA